MRIEEVADEWGISRRTVYRLVERKLLPAEIVSYQITQDRFDIAASLVSQVKSEIDTVELSEITRPTLVRKYLTQLKESRESGRSNKKKED